MRPASAPNKAVHMFYKLHGAAMSAKITKAVINCRWPFQFFQKGSMSWYHETQGSYIAQALCTALTVHMPLIPRSAALPV